MFNSTEAKHLKKKRFRKNEDQLKKLIKFYQENKEWSKGEIKRISEDTGLKENKVYKWLWDQRNKEFKNTKFVINKNDKFTIDYQLYDKNNNELYSSGSFNA